MNRENLSQAGESHMDHLARCDRHAALRIEPDDNVMKVFALIGRVRDREPFIFCPRHGLFGAAEPHSPRLLRALSNPEG